MKPLSVTIIGAGNLAWHLAPALDNVGFAVREIYSRKAKNAEALASHLYQSEAVTDLDFSESPSKIFLLCVADDAIPSVVSELILPANSILAHTSGSQPLSVLKTTITPDTGVFYPLQTFSKARKVDFSGVPFFVESEKAEVEKILMSMAKALSRKVVRISSEDRRALHVAAVFAANFTNHMLTLSKEVMTNHGLNFDYLKPLIAETLNKSLEIGPDKSQTGPARRGDLEILDTHMEMLKDDASVAEIYKIVSQHIIDTYNGD